MVVQLIPAIKSSLIMLATGLMAGMNFKENKSKLFLIAATFFIVVAITILFTGVFYSLL